MISINNFYILLFWLIYFLLTRIAEIRERLSEEEWNQRQEQEQENDNNLPELE